MITKEKLEIVLAGADDANKEFKKILKLAIAKLSEEDGSIDWKAHYDSLRRQADATVADKDATIRRLKEKLENIESIIIKFNGGFYQTQSGSAGKGSVVYLQDIPHSKTVEQQLSEECSRLHDMWHTAEEALNVMRDRCSSLDIERSILQRWKDEAIVSLNKWGEVYDYLLNHKDTYLGDKAWVACMKFLKERDVLKFWFDSRPEI